ncbi:polysaccharide biosynthesis/export family protein [Acidocella aromatica]|uniref:Polysaccharide export outer membrane protein n=1 Tax=Acidocella aromatica TaxID=1303579 RepID=A0A840VE85_9PROT|nr:polysaccharide biosynthesis/export family protein [Acidocella aromatica]MBB5374044.1 polysaccharide export outer membrane protein [Acidocella aromatica]
MHKIPRCWKVRTIQFLIVPAFNLLLSACASPPSPMQSITASAANTGSAVLSSDLQTLPPSKLPPSQSLDTGAPYRLGPDDIIGVTVYMHPELSEPQQGATSGLGGVMITSDGTVNLPLIGTINLNGITIDNAQQKLNAAYATYVNNPNVTVQLVAAQSLRYYLLGAFRSPGVKYPGRVMTLLDTLSLGDSVDLTNADLYQAYVVQNKQKLPIDFHALLAEGDLSQNITLAPGDTIVIPTASAEDAYVFGAVGKPGAVPFQSGALSLPQALSVAGMDLQNYTTAELSQVRVIRTHGATADFMVVDAARILRGQAVPFALQPGDIVFVPADGIGSWNQVLSQLLPSLQAISGALNPFVAIAYLSRHN